MFDVYEIMQPGPLGAADTGDIAGLKCRDYTVRYVAAVPWVCQGLISRLNRACIKGPLNSAPDHLHVPANINQNGCNSVGKGGGMPD